MGIEMVEQGVKRLFELLFALLGLGDLGFVAVRAGFFQIADGVGEFLFEFRAWDLQQFARQRTAEPLGCDENQLGRYGDESLFLAQGDTTAALFRYDIGGDTWESMPDIPVDMMAGASMVCANEALYVLPGGGSTDFWIFKP